MNRLQTISSVTHPSDIITGLGSADRKLLLTLIALFEVSKLGRQVSNKLGELVEDAVSLYARFKKVTSNYKYESETVETRIKEWDNASFTDNELRIVLWIYLREALSLPPKSTISFEGLSNTADELMSAALSFANEENLIEKLKRYGTRKQKTEMTTLDELVGPVMQEMMEQVIEQLDKMDASSRKAFYDQVKTKLDSLDPNDRKLILDSVGSTRFNEEAIRRVILTSGGLIAFGGAVEIAGFSAYILAAQLSAFIPLVSGPGLVSFVAVLSNPVTIIGGTIAATYYASRSANKKVAGAIALRVIAMLTMMGMSGRDKQKKAHQNMLHSFPNLVTLKENGDLKSEHIRVYGNDWKLFSEVTARNTDILVDSELTEWLEMSIRMRKSGRIKDLVFVTDEEFEKTSVVLGLTVGDVLYNLYSIDPVVVTASDFARTVDITSKMDFASFASEVMSKSPSSINGTISNLKGYVSEQVVAAQLVAKGHHIEFPNASNQEGWDLLVDGVPTQVKNTATQAGLREHFEKFDFPVIANSELIGNVPAEFADKVYFVEGYSNEVVEQVTRNSLESGADTFDPDVPLFAIAVSAAFAYKNYKKGYVTANQAWEQVVLEGFTRTGLAIAGGAAGSGIGLLVFGPAGALVWGILAPVMAQSQTTRVTNKIKNSVKTSVYREWERKVRSEIDGMKQTIQKNLDWRLESLRDDYRKLDDSEIQRYLKLRITQKARGFQELKIRLKSITKPDIEDTIRELLTLVSRSPIHPMVYQNHLKAIAELLKQKPSLKEQWDKITDGGENSAQIGTLNRIDRQ